jgi:hypothetical protein
MRCDTARISCATAVSPQNQWCSSGLGVTDEGLATGPLINNTALTGTKSSSGVYLLISPTKKQERAELRRCCPVTLWFSGLSERTRLAEHHQYTNYGHSGQR